MDFLNPYLVVDIPLLELIRNMVLGIALALAWSFVVGRASRLIVDTRQYLPLFLLLMLSMILIISTIKTSIALSLGLVGALSIVRFRTPIKEPEEPIYIFVVIAMGLGLGANQVLPTIIGFVVIVLTFIPYTLTRGKQNRSQNSFIDLTLFSQEGKSVDTHRLDQLMAAHLQRYKVRRVFATPERTEMMLEVSRLSLEDFEALKAKLAEHSPNFEMSMTSNARVIT